MKPSRKRDMADTKTMIEVYEMLVRDYPLNEVYQDNLAELRKELAEMASSIGRKAKSRNVL